VRTTGDSEGPVTARDTFVAAVCYAAVTLAFWSPILATIGDEVITTPGDEPWDHMQVFWNAWWIGRSLFHGANPYFCDVVFVPYGAPLVFHALAPIQASAMNGLSTVVSSVLAYNVLAFGAFVLAGVGAYALARQITRHHVGSVVGGLAFMLCPYVVNKPPTGWMNMAYVGVLPLYLASLLHSTTRPASHAWRARALLAGATLLVLFTGDVNVVLAANVTLGLFVWHVWAAPARRKAAAEFIRAVVPAAVVAIPYGALLAYYIVTYQLSPDPGARLDFVPDVLSFVLPFTGVSPYGALLARLGFSDATLSELARSDIACYLGLLVLPLSVWGLRSTRANPAVRFMAWLFAVFVILSLGPKLLYLREIVTVGGWQIRLPFRVWTEIPLLGAIGQPGRYMAIPYMALSVGIACVVSMLWQRRQRGAALAGTIAVVLAVCLDFAYWPGSGAVPAVPSLPEQTGIVMDPRLRSGATMYFQTHHGRPLVGGYLSRRPEHVLRQYRQIPGFDCIFFGNRSADCGRETIVASLRTYGVGAVLLDPTDWRGDMVEALGFRKHYADRWTVVWAVPGK
jgi:hypothetical protein